MVEFIEKNSLEEKEVIQRIVLGEKGEFETLVSNYQEMVYAIIIKQVSNEVIAKDLTQETFIKAYFNLSSFRFEAKFSTWLIRIALNLTNSYFQSKRYKQKQKTMHLDLEQYNQTPDERSIDSLDLEAIDKLNFLISQLRPKLREVMILCGLEQRSYKETAEILNVPVGTVRSRLNKARLILKELYFKD